MGVACAESGTAIDGAAISRFRVSGVQHVELCIALSSDALSPAGIATLSSPC